MTNTTNNSNPNSNPNSNSEKITYIIDNYKCRIDGNPKQIIQELKRMMDDPRIDAQILSVIHTLEDYDLILKRIEEEVEYYGSVINDITSAKVGEIEGDIRQLRTCHEANELYAYWMNRYNQVMVSVETIASDTFRMIKSIYAYSIKTDAEVLKDYGITMEQHLLAKQRKLEAQVADLKLSQSMGDACPKKAPPKKKSTKVDIKKIKSKGLNKTKTKSKPTRTQVENYDQMYNGEE